MRKVKLSATQMACSPDIHANIAKAEELVREAASKGAKIILFPTAIGTEPPNPTYDSRDHWQMCMRGHSASNIMPVVESNRIGTETFENSEITFYGSSFITDNKGRKIAEMDRTDQGVVVEEVDLDAFQKERDAWGLFRDRRPEKYGPLMTLDGETNICREH